MQINILSLTEGARQAKGLTVIIDVFRAFTVEAYFARNHAQRIIPVSQVEFAFAYREQHPGTILCGERKGIMVEGFDYGNSPAAIENVDFTGKTVVHTTSAGTQGIANALQAEEIIGGSLVNARAIAEYIRQRNPETVSLVAMGLGGTRQTDEDQLCATYIKSMIEDVPIRNMDHRIARLKYTDGAKFFAPEKQQVFPERDFHLSTAYDSFDFVLRYKKDPETGIGYMERVDVTYQPRKTACTKVQEGDMLSQFTREQVVAFPQKVKAALSYGSYTPPEGNFDAALIMGGNPDVLPSRAAAAAKLYHQGRCGLFIPTGGVKWETEFGFLSEADTLRRYLLQQGVPQSAILCEANATTTRENMECSRQLLCQRMDLSKARIAVVTSAYHGRRSLLLSQYYLPQAQLFEVRAEAPGDNPCECFDDPRLATAVTSECRFLLDCIQKGQIADIPLTLGEEVC